MTEDERSWRWWKLFFWQLLTKPALLLIYVSVIAEAWHFLIPGLNKSIMLGLKGSQILSLFMGVAVFRMWELSLMVWLGYELDTGTGNAKRHKSIVVTLAIVLLVCDFCLLYLGLTRLGWGKSMLSFGAFLSAIAWCGILVYVTFVTVGLKRKLEK